MITKDKARSLVSKAVKDGELVKPLLCSDCGDKNTLQGHHSDYQKPLEVAWLCRDCHTKRHFENGKRIKYEGYSKYTQIRISVEYWQKLRLLADAEGRTMANMVERLIDIASGQKPVKTAKKESK